MQLCVCVSVCTHVYVAFVCVCACMQLATSVCGYVHVVVDGSIFSNLLYMIKIDCNLIVLCVCVCVCV